MKRKTFNHIDGDKKTLLSVLGNNHVQSVVIHYVCENCNDEQVTYDMCSDESMMDSFSDNDCIILGYECTNCGVRIGTLHYSEIFGVEVM